MKFNIQLYDKIGKYNIHPANSLRYLICLSKRQFNNEEEILKISKDYIKKNKHKYLENKIYFEEIYGNFTIKLKVHNNSLDELGCHSLEFMVNDSGIFF